MGLRTWKTHQRDRWNAWPLRRRAWTLNVLIVASAIATGFGASDPVPLWGGILTGLGGGITGILCSQRMRLHQRSRGTRIR